MNYLNDDHSVINMRLELEITEIEIQRLKDLKVQLEKESASIPYTDLLEKKSVLKQIQSVQDALQEQTRIERLLKKNLAHIESIIPRLKGTQRKVFYLQQYLGLSLIEIAEMLDYDYDYIRHVAAKTRKIN